MANDVVDWEIEARYYRFLLEDLRAIMVSEDFHGLPRLALEWRRRLLPELHEQMPKGVLNGDG